MTRDKAKERRATNQAIAAAVATEKSFAARVLKAIRIMHTPKGVPMTRLSEALDCTKQPLYTALRDLVRANKITRLSAGYYVANPTTGREPDKADVMWRLLRARRRVTVADLVEGSGASPAYAREVARGWVEKGLAAKQPDSSFRLVQDPGPKAPAREQNADRLKAIRAHKKLVASLETMKAALEEALAAVSEVAQ